jgi:hypothetical protein
MKPAGLFAAIVLCTITIACERGGEHQRALETAPPVYGDQNLVPPRPVIVDGCLTASGERLVLTELEPGVRGPIAARRYGRRPWAEEEPTTEAYRLVGMDEQLRQLVGQRVEIIGEAELEQVVDVREWSPRLDPWNRRPVGTSGSDAHVSAVQTTTRIEISDLNVRSARAMGEKCLASR